MQSLIPPLAYIDPDWFERERKLLFSRLWLFAAPRMLLAKPNAFVTLTLAGIPVVIQNFDGELRAFENVCPHRQAALQTESHGVRPLVCKYHGWKIGSNGKVANLPFDESMYRYPATECDALQVRQFAVHCIGNLIFVNLAAEPIAIDKQFSPQLITKLTEVSGAFDGEVLIARFNTRLNWKLAYENLRDGMHPRYVHPVSIYPVVRFQPSIDEARLKWTRAYHAHGSTTADDHLDVLRRLSRGGLSEPIPNMERHAWHEYVTRYGKDDWYLDWLVYPNLHIASASGGHSFIIEHHQPVAPDRTELVVYYVTARKTRPYAFSPAVLLSHIKGADVVLREDIDIMEQVQRSLHRESPRAMLGDFEHENMMVERWYMDVMEGNHAL